MMKKPVIVLCFVLGLIAPVAAQQAIRVFGTTEGAVILPVLVDSTGRLIVDHAEGPISPTEVLLPDSTCSDPALARVSGPTTGLAFTSTPSILNCVSGTARTTLTASSLTSTVPLLAPNGSASAPSYSWASEPQSGLWREGTNLFNYRVDSGNIWQTNTTGLILGTTRVLGWGSSGVSTPDVSLSRGAANVLQLASGDMLSFGGVAAGNLLLKPNGSELQVKTGDDSGFSGVKASQFTTSTGAILLTSTAPTVNSAGTSPSVPNSNGTASFRVNVGTGGTATTIVMTMPAASNGWNCDAENITAAAANRANQAVKQQASTTTSVTVQNQTVSTGAALAFTASDIVRFICFAY